LKLILVLAITWAVHFDAMAGDDQSVSSKDFIEQVQDVGSEDSEIINNLDFFENWDSFQDDDNFNENSQEQQVSKGEEYEQ
jgi:hypothetical protein